MDLELEQWYLLGFYPACYNDELMTRWPIMATTFRKRPVIAPVMGTSSRGNSAECSVFFVTLTDTTVKTVNTRSFYRLTYSVLDNENNNGTTDFLKQHEFCRNSNGCWFSLNYPDSKVHGANMGPTWVLSAPDGLHVGPMNLAIRVCLPIWTLTCDFWELAMSAI